MEKVWFKSFEVKDFLENSNYAEISYFSLSKTKTQ